MRTTPVSTVRAFKEVQATALRYDRLREAAHERLAKLKLEGAGRRQGICASPEQRKAFQEARDEFIQLYALSATLNRLKKALYSALDSATPARIEKLTHAMITLYGMVYGSSNGKRDRQLAYQATFFRWPAALWEAVDPTESLRSMRAEYFQKFGPAMKAWTQVNVSPDKSSEENLAYVFDTLGDSQKTAVLFKFMQAWKNLPEVSGKVKPSFEDWVQNIINRSIAT